MLFTMTGCMLRIVEIFHTLYQVQTRQRIMVKSPGFNLLVILFVACLFFTCSSRRKQPVRENSVEEKELSANVTEADLLSTVLKRGNEVTGISQKALASKLKGAIEAGGVINAIEFCNLNAYPIIDSLEEVMGAEIRRVTIKSRNPKDDPDQLEKSILDAYQNAHSKDEILRDNVQSIGEGSHFLYTKPIVIENNLCLVCHGVPGVELTTVNQQTILSFYPEDKATGYKIGDLRGMWSIRIPKDRL